MKLRDYLLNISNEELTERLKYLDKAIHELHDNGYFVVGDLADIEINDNKITIDSFKNKIDYLNSGYNINGDRQDILEECCIGVCAYNKLSVLHTSKEFIEYVIDNVEMFLEHGNIPDIIQEYYIDVFNRGNVGYLNDFIAKHEYELKNGNSSTNNKSMGAYTKSTPVGRALAEKENNAFVSILVLPALLALLYISAVVIYFVFIK